MAQGMPAPSMTVVGADWEQLTAKLRGSKVYAKIQETDLL
jgi:hypothetical protein